MLERSSIVKVISKYAQNAAPWIGTGSLMSSAGHVLTCAHVILAPGLQDEGAVPSDCDVTLEFVADKERRRFPAELLEWVPTKEGDLALLKLKDGLPPGAAQPIRFMEAFGEEHELGASGNVIHIQGFPDELTHDLDVLKGTIIGSIPPPESIFQNPRIRKISKIQYSSNIFKGYSGAAVYLNGYGYLGIFSFYTDNSQSVGYCISGACIHRLFRKYFAEEDKESGDAQILIIGADYHSPFQKEMNAVLERERFFSDEEYNLSFRVFDASDDETNEERLQEAYNAADMIVFEITSDERCLQLWQKYEGFGCLAPSVLKSPKDVVFADWSAGEVTTMQYIEKFKRSLKQTHPDIEKRIAEDVNFCKKYPDENISRIVGNYKGLKNQFPGETSKSFFNVLFKEFHSRLSHPIAPSEFRNSLLDFDFVNLKREFDRQHRDGIKFALLGIEGSRDCALELLIKNILQQRFKSEYQSPIPLSIEKSGIRDAADLWRELATQCLGLPKEASVSRIVSHLLLKLEGDGDLVLMFTDLFSGVPTAKESKNLYAMLSAFWSQLVEEVKQKRPRNRLFIFVVNKFYDHKSKTGRIGLERFREAEVQVFSLPPTDQFEAKEGAMAIKEWYDAKLKHYSKKEREKIDRNMDRLASHLHTRPLLEELCRLYHPETFEYTERV
ncbi:MAG: trypsin-like peptidase domain-containing protein [Lewinellaceae bacterium]|nr:trypsin-like peptidase domain-containing protein [Lewinellaceae bacterium]